MQQMNLQVEAATAAQTPSGLNPLILDVRDIEQAHRF
jgi:hypothetical protein